MTKFGLHMITVALLLAAIPAVPRSTLADGRYRIFVDENGLVFQTESEGEWYIPEEDQPCFKPGQSGIYRMGHDSEGRYLLTEQGKFYLGMPEREDGHGAGRSVTRPDAASSRGARATAIIVAGQHVIVPVSIRHRGRSLQLNLLLDTGASIITLHKEAVRGLRLKGDKKANFSTAAGHVIEADLVALEEVRFGPYRQENVLAGVIERKQSPAVIFDGLLGMNALKGINYRIDFENGSINWVDK